MIEQNIEVRHVQKHETEANWKKVDTFIPKRGEIIIYDIDENYSYERIKIGDGITSLKDLSFKLFQSDWTQNDINAHNYINNRSHYEETINKDFYSNDNLIIYADQYKESFLKVFFQEGAEYTIVWNGQTYTCTARDDGYDDIYIGNQRIAFEVMGWTFPEDIVSNEPFFLATYAPDRWSIIMTADEGTFSISIKETEKYVKQLDEKYIPDSILRVQDWKQADWNQEDDTAKDFIKNKPNFLEIQAQADWLQQDTSSPDFIKNKPVFEAGDGLVVTDNKTNINISFDDDTVFYLDGGNVPMTPGLYNNNTLIVDWDTLNVDVSKSYTSSTSSQSPALYYALYNTYNDMCKIGKNELVVPSGIDTIGTYAFRNCSRLSALHLPDTLKTFDPTSVYWECRVEEFSVDSNNKNFSTIDGHLCNKEKTILYRHAPYRNEETYTIPKTITTIAYKAFHGDSSTKNLIIPSHVTQVANEAVSYCYGFDTVDIACPTISENMFEHSNIRKVILQPEVKEIKSYAFNECNYLNTIDFSEGLEIIGQGAFGDTGISELILPEGLTTLGKYAFSFCPRLTTVSIPSTMTSLEVGAFGGCLAIVAFESQSPHYKTINGILYNGDVTEILEYPAGNSSLTEYVIPDTVTTLRANCIDDAVHLTKITLPNSITTIESCAFMRSGITEITFPTKITEIADGVCSNCANLTTVTINSNITAIKARAFMNCPALTTIIINDSTPPTLDASALTGCANLTAIKVPASSVASYQIATNWKNFSSIIKSK